MCPQNMKRMAHRNIGTLNTNDWKASFTRFHDGIQKAPEKEVFIPKIP